MGCSKHHTPSIYESTKIIAHRGNGSVGSGLGQYEENTVDACISRFSLVDGVEVDVQRSNDFLVYLYHDTQVEACSEHDIKSIAASAQDKINDQFDCLGKRPNTLAQLFDYTSTQNENKDIFIDVKTIAHFSTLLKMPTAQHYLNLMAQDLFKLIETYKYASSVNIESENAVLLNAFKKHHPETKTWLASYGDIDKATKRACKESYTGISIKDGDWLTRETIAAAHKQGLQVCVWVVNDQARFNELKEMEVDFVQTDNLYLER